MTAVAIIRGLCRSDKDTARWLGVSVRTARRYRSEGIPSGKLRELADRLQAIVDHRLAELAAWERGIDDLRRAHTPAPVDNRSADLRGGRMAADAARRVLPEKSGGGGSR